MTAENINFYVRHYKEYFQQTYRLNSDFFLKPFADNLSVGATVLDVGCGSGRDLLWLKKKGFRPTGFERSPGLAGLAAEYSGCRVIEGDFETYDFSRLSFDALLASGAFVHIPHDHLADIIQNIKNALLPDGLFYISLKKGMNKTTGRTGRTFYLWQDADLQKIFTSCHMEILHFSETTALRNMKDVWLGYTLQIRHTP